MKTTKKMRKWYFGVVDHLSSRNFDRVTFIMYCYGLWDILSKMLIGIALFKWNALSDGKSYRVYGLTVVIFYGIGLPTNYHEIAMIISSGFSFEGFSTSFFTYDLCRISMAMGTPVSLDFL